ncbi:MAG: DUF4148 domain-containing protein, partial [Burkholderiales bacterium]|nr:DUF4148 domain-containing protein [Burkholderiales bacterium]
MTSLHKLLPAALACAALFSVAAQAAPLTRAEVRVAVVQARADGTLMPTGEASPNAPAAATPSTLTRAAVVAQ